VGGELIWCREKGGAWKGRGDIQTAKTANIHPEIETVKGAEKERKKERWTNKVIMTRRRGAV
jgi:hypothetical protein